MLFQPLFRLNTMKRLFLALAALSLPSVAGAAAVGGFAGSDAGVFYLTNRGEHGRALRFNLNANLSAFHLDTLSNTFAVGGGVDYLHNLPGTDNFDPIRMYYGLGLSASMTLKSDHAYSLYPHGTLGMEYELSRNLTVFFEGNAGPVIGFKDGKTGYGPQAGARVGIIHMLGR